MTITFQQFLRRLSTFWEEKGCITHQGYDLEVGAGTFNPATFLRSLGPEPYRAAYIEPCRRPADGRYGTNPNRLQHYFQFQVIIKPSPSNIQELYLQSLEAIGFDLKAHDIRFVHDDWESPTLGAWGLGWEVWMDGMEITQFTYFQAIGGVELHPITVEITYGIERLAMYLQKVDSIFDLQWNNELTYGDVYLQNEIEWSHYNFEHSSPEMWYKHFEDFEKEAKKLIGAALPIPAYDFVMKASHAFNMLDARGVISVTERTGYIGRIRDLAKLIAEAYGASREQQGFPLLKLTKTEDVPQKLPSLEASYTNDTEDFLLEIGSEELPALFVDIGMQNLEKLIRQLLEKEAIPFKQLSVYGTPRRLAVFIEGLKTEKPTKTIEKKGPSLDQSYQADGTLKPAGEGFFRSIGIKPPALEEIQQKTVEQVEIRLIKEIPYLIGFIREEGKSTAKILQEKLPELILSIDFPKKMRWSDLEITYARPIQWIAAIFGPHVIPFQVGNVISNRLSYGHRQLAPKSFNLSQPSNYLEDLREKWVMADTKERNKTIHTQLDTLETQENITVIERQRVIPQVLHLVEWPFITLSTFDEQFLKIPKEVLISEMVEHQKYFPVALSNGGLTNQFVITANTHPTDQIREGNQRVLSARLSDGAFLYKEDLKHPLEFLNEKLKKVTFQKELGTVYEKVERIKKHVAFIQKALKISSSDKALRAAELCKADLASQMVYEFPELQGTIGRYYAEAQKEDSEVAQAIDEQWMPRGEHGSLPKSETGTILSLADKFDNLIGCFSVGLKPTSSSDPYALRRQVLGIIKILVQGEYTFSIQDCLLNCVDHFPPHLMHKKQEVIKEIILFITNRIKTVFVDYHFGKDEIEASLSKECDDIFDAFCRVQALHRFRNESSEQFRSLFEVYKRAKGQLQGHHSSTFDATVLKEPAEKELIKVLVNQEHAFRQAVDQKNYREAYAMIATLQAPLARLFDEVKILSDDLQVRESRLGLLKKVFDLLDQIVDFSKIQ